MPYAAQARCSEPRCGQTAIIKGKCLDHYVPWERQSPRNALLSSSERLRFSRQILARDPICRSCGTRPATEADHIIPVSDGGALTDLNNGQGLCHLCHAAKTLKENKERSRRRHTDRN